MNTSTHDTHPTDLPGENDDKVHDVPTVSQVGVLVEGKAKGQDLYSRLETEDADEIRLRVILVKRGEDQVQNEFIFTNTVRLMSGSIGAVETVHLI